MTFSQGNSALGSQPMILPRARAMSSVRSMAWAVVYVLPVIPQVKGLRLLAMGWRP
jgi:hypothetical protein